MKKTRAHLIGKMIKIFGPLFAAATFSCCYGPGPYPMEGPNMLSGKITDSETGDGINGLVITLLSEENGVQTVCEIDSTSSDGRFWFYLSPMYDTVSTFVVKATDVDGDSNGGSYAGSAVSLEYDNAEKSTVVDISLSKE